MKNFPRSKEIIILFLFGFLSNTVSGQAELINPKKYWLHLYDVIQKGDPTNWCDEITKAYCDRGESFVKVHFSIWRKQILDFVEKNYQGDPHKVPVKFKDNDKLVLGKNSGFHILMENGRWRMNEN